MNDVRYPFELDPTLQQLAMRGGDVADAAVENGMGRLDAGFDLPQIEPDAVAVEEGLETAGLARRERDPEDRRVVRLAATPAGRRLLERGRRARVERLAELLAPLAGDDLAKLGRALTALTTAVGLEAAPASALP